MKEVKIEVKLNDSLNNITKKNILTIMIGNSFISLYFNYENIQELLKLIEKGVEKIINYEEKK